MKYVLALSVLLILMGCTSTKPINIVHPDLNDTHFDGFESQPIETEDEIFHLNQDARRFVDEVTAKQTTSRGKLQSLLNAIFNRTSLSLNYRAGANTVATQTFYSREVNCLSLTIMAHAMTQHLGMTAKFRKINIPEYWTRREGNTLINRHINLEVLTRDPFKNVITEKTLIIDFDPQQVHRRYFATPLAKEEVVAQFYVNKAADLMLSKNYSGAYAYLREAIEVAPSYEGGWLNLGVLHSRIDQYELAEEYYNHVLLLSPNYPTAMENLAHLYQKTDRKEAAAQILSSLHRQRLENPFYHSMLGDIAYDEKDFSGAIKHYQQAMKLNRRLHEFHFRLAISHLAMNNLERGLAYLESGKALAETEGMQRRYDSKIAILSQI